ncbi:MAG: cysteine hydrolase family protein [Mycobacterium sp.]
MDASPVIPVEGTNQQEGRGRRPVDRREHVHRRGFWCSSGFANTDLDLLLKKHGIHRLIVVGLITHTCVEATVRYGAELGYDVTVVRDATAGYSDAEMHAALEVNMPNYAAVVTTEEIVAAMSAG